jgi:two-component system, chemotaxis family, protein-glutamate methylesterase/glutaminase
MPYEAIVIGTSAGALEALSKVLPTLPAGFLLPVMVVVHLPPDKESILAQLLKNKCALEVKEAEDKEEISAGNIYIAPPDYHMQVEQNKHISLSCDEPILFSRPSIDVLFESAADAYGENLIGIILTGANEDGASGLKTICDAGGMAIVQNVDTAYAKAMPESALKACPAAHSMSLEQIATYLQKVI